MKMLQSVSLQTTSAPHNHADYLPIKNLKSTIDRVVNLLFSPTDKVVPPPLISPMIAIPTSTLSTRKSVAESAKDKNCMSLDTKPNVNSDEGIVILSLSASVLVSQQICKFADIAVHSLVIMEGLTRILLSILKLRSPVWVMKLRLKIAPCACVVLIW